eukprot:CAMPEP_0173108120 /NCGR_PEP_ID=MMETSP1102-20130122/42445_1 /TAXON_ID=49646 /ORGANISM="Geminigera sp., Strain Caron Lab Isolate" /LENGTH=143 /DNA_ID=CAMNT_0014006363 /DNA_START=495 /DNA_END=926 /DNA_ORIENTATION=+
MPLFPSVPVKISAHCAGPPKLLGRVRLVPGAAGAPYLDSAPLMCDIGDVRYGLSDVRYAVSDVRYAVSCALSDVEYALSQGAMGRASRFASAPPPLPVLAVAAATGEEAAAVARDCQQPPAFQQDASPLWGTGSDLDKSSVTS